MKAVLRASLLYNCVLSGWQEGSDQSLRKRYKYSVVHGSKKRKINFRKQRKSQQSLSLLSSLMNYTPMQHQGTIHIAYFKLNLYRRPWCAVMNNNLCISCTEASTRVNKSKVLLSKGRMSTSSSEFVSSLKFFASCSKHELIRK